MKKNQGKDVINLHEFAKSKENTRYLDLDLFEVPFSTICHTVDHLLGPNASYNETLMLYPDQNGRNFLMMMAMVRNVKYVKFLFKFVTNYYINLQDKDGKTALFYACDVEGQYLDTKAQSDYQEIIRLILEAGALPYLKTNDGKTPLMVMSVQAGYKNFELMLENFADVNAEAHFGDNSHAYSNCLDPLIEALRYSTDYKGRLITDGSEEQDTTKKILKLYRENGLKQDIGRGTHLSIQRLEELLETDLVKTAMHVPRIPKSEIVERQFSKLVSDIVNVDNIDIPEPVRRYADSGLVIICREKYLREYQRREKYLREYQLSIAFTYLTNNLSNPLIYENDSEGYTLYMLFVLFNFPDRFIVQLLTNAPEGYVLKKNKYGHTAHKVYTEELKSLRLADKEFGQTEILSCTTNEAELHGDSSQYVEELS